MGLQTPASRLNGSNAQPCVATPMPSSTSVCFRAQARALPATMHRHWSGLSLRYKAQRMNPRAPPRKPSMILFSSEYEPKKPLERKKPLKRWTQFKRR